MTTRIPGLDITTVRELVGPLDPVASVYLGLTPPTPTIDTSEDLDLRWRSLRKDLADQPARAGPTGWRAGAPDQPSWCTPGQGRARSPIPP